jgi:N-acetylneuraminate synthase
MTRFIAEIGSNHNRDPERAHQLVECSARAGCGAVKLQVFRIDDLFSPEALAANPDLDARREWEFPLEMLPDLRAQCDELGLELGVTPFSLWVVDAVADSVDFFKVASYEVLWHDLLRACASAGKPVVLSTGMASQDEIAAAVDVAGERVTLLHCVSGYPTPPDQANLRAISTLRAAYGHPVGWSDHTGEPSVVARAVRRWNASDIELHVDLDGGGFEAGEHNWAPERIRAAHELIAGEHEPGTEAMDGDGRKVPQPVERPDVPWRADPTDGLRPLRSLRAQLTPTAAGARRDDAG